MTLSHHRPTPDGTAAAPDHHQVLVVDDEPTVRRYAARVLREEGFPVREAADGAEALALLESGTVPVHCVVSDVVMPRLNGVQLLEALSLRWPELPVILMSAYGTVQLAERGISAPCALLRKPFEPEDLLDEVRRCLARRT